jgi:hypothetical protein
MAKSSEMSIFHINGIRLRILGEGDLKSAVFSYMNKDQECKSQYLVDLSMDDIMDRLPVVLANFKSMAIQYEFRTTEIDEFLYIGKVILFVKPVSTGYPQ